MGGRGEKHGGPVLRPGGARDVGHGTPAAARRVHGETEGVVHQDLGYFSNLEHSQERDRFLRWLGVANNALDQLYYPVEHVAWAAERQILPPSLRGLSQWCLKIWACSLTLNILRSLRALIILRLKKQRLAKTKQMEENDEADIKASMKTLRLQEFNVWLTLVGSSTDLVNAINWMPPGFLWAGKNPLALTGVMGMISSSIGLYRVYASKVKQA
ncbi:peroxisomal membrane protein 11C-like isoform X2 [Branchiostoma floridae x Branchiostoma belcheri]